MTVLLLAFELCWGCIRHENQISSRRKLEISGKLSRKKSYAARHQRRARADPTGVLGAAGVRKSGGARYPLRGRSEAFAGQSAPMNPSETKAFEHCKVLPLSFLQEAYKLEWGFMNPIRGDSDKSLLKITNGATWKWSPSCHAGGTALSVSFLKPLES